MSTSVTAQLELREAFTELDALTRTPGKLNPEQQKRSSYLLAKISALKSGSLVTDEERNAKADAIAKEFGIDPNVSGEQRASQELRSFINGETRTYAALTTTANGALVPVQFEKQLVMTAMAAGPLVAGSTACSEVQTPTGAARKMPLTDDLSNAGFVQTEAGSPTEAEIALSQDSLGTSIFSSGIVVLSNELLQDADWIVTGEKVLQGTLGKRLGRIQNSTFLAALMTALAANSSASVAAAGSSLAYSDLTNLVGSVNAQYRYSEKAGFLMNSSTQKAIANLKDSQLRPLFADVMASRPKLMDYPVFVSDYADSITSTKNPILFGDWSYVFIRHVPGIELQVMSQRFMEQYSTGFIARKRADLQYAVPTTADSAIKMLHFA